MSVVHPPVSGAIRPNEQIEPVHVAALKRLAPRLESANGCVSEHGGICSGAVIRYRQGYRQIGRLSTDRDRRRGERYGQNGAGIRTFMIFRGRLWMGMWWTNTRPFRRNISTWRQGK